MRALLAVLARPRRAVVGLALAAEILLALAPPSSIVGTPAAA